jgi:hypothetical protein
MQPETSDYDGYFWNGSDWEQYLHIPPSDNRYRKDPDLKQTYMDQFTVGIERELIKDFSIGATFIYRTNHDPIAAVDIGGIYEEVPYTDSNTGQTFTVYNQVNDPGDSVYLITNPDPDKHENVLFTPERKYVGFEILLNKRFSHNWQMMASYVYSESTGNMDNSFAVGSGSTSLFENPNHQINSDGKLTYDFTHMLKIQASVILPLDINLNANFSVISGPNYQLYGSIPTSVDVNRSSFYMEPRGSRRYPSKTNLDLRLEKTLKFGKLKLGLLLDIFNVFNADTVTSLSGYINTFEEILGIRTPRAFRAGLRLWF